MFYSQFILAKKGPLGTIWIAAHLERKLRKNQVADTDIGVSVDSILFPEVPIALRLSSHLLLGVVRIYSRKVNYLFDDCSEALLKIKQAFRSTAVDLPPEESTAPYHSITLPETFDLDDFELPDNDIFQGNYVDHHVSAREQITLQDTMEGVVYATSQFGLDERFGDGDASQIGFDLDEDLLLDKAATVERDGIIDANLQASPLLEGPQQREEMKAEAIEIEDEMQVEYGGSKIGGLPSATDVSEYPQGPSTPGLEEPNLFGDQVAQVFGEAELQLMKSPENVSMTDHGEKDAIDCTLQSNAKQDNAVCSHHDEKACPSVGLHSKRGQQEHSAGITMSEDHENLEANNHSSTPSLLMVSSSDKKLVPECTDGTIGASDITEKVKDLHDGLAMNNEPILAPPDQTGMKCAHSGDRVNETLGCSHITSDLEVPTCKLLSNSDGSQGPESEGHLEDEHTSLKHKIAMDVEIASSEGECRPFDDAKISGAVRPLESCGKHEVVDAEAQASQLKEVEAMNHVAHEPMPSVGSHLHPCTSCLSQPDVLSVEDEQCHMPHVSDPVVDDHITGEHIDPAVREEVLPGSKKLDEPLGDQFSTDDILESINSSAVLGMPAPERMLSVAYQPDGEPNDLLIESTPNNQGITGGNIVDAGVKSTSGKKRTFAESTVTVPTVDLVESYMGTQSKRTAEFIPDDDDLLSSILVGRKSSILKLKPTPAAPEITSVKRLRSAARTSASKRKVLMDDTMVLHGDTIRQQLTNTEDIRRIRKKAPCTRREIVMIERQFLEDEIFHEPIFTGVSADLILMRSEIFDLTRIKVCNYDLDSSSMDATNDERSYSRIHITEIHGGEMNIGDAVVQGDVDAQPAEMLTLSECYPAEVELGTHHIDAHDHVDIASHLKGFDNSQNAEKTCRRSLQGYDAENCSDAPGLEATSGTSLVFGNNTMPDDLGAPLTVTVKPNDDGSMHTDMLDMATFHNVNTVSIPEDKYVENEGDNNGIGAVEIRTLVQTEGSEGGNSLYASFVTGSKEIDECSYRTVINGDLPLEEIGNKLGGLNEDQTFASGLGCDDKDSITGCMFSEDTRKDCIRSVAPVLDAQETSLNEEISVCQEAGLWSSMHSEISAIESSFIDHNGDNANVADDTEFLNVGDDEIVGDDEDCIPCTEGTDLENSGWSSRTRAVAKYLQILFDREALHGGKNLPLDNILAGKTRKEASRMFFETLVLKTKDYVHVDQTKPFANINIKPRAKLMKSDF